MRAQIEEMRFDVGDVFSGRRKPTLVFLTREPKTWDVAVGMESRTRDVMF